ncbi:MAG TPA: hypothetical protein V6C72_02810, partial [Chroococcales cyanobacterium]
FDLSQLDTSDPLRRVGSGRQAIKSGRSDLEDALANLNGDSPDSAAAIQSIEKALTNVDGGAANIHKAVGLEESGQPDHRPEASAATGDILSQPAQPTAIDSVQAQPAPPVVHQKEYNDGQRHLGNSTGGLRGARSSIEQGDMNEAGKDLKYSLKELQSGTKDLRYSFGNVLPGEDSFNTADSQMLDALSAFQKNDYNETLAYIHRALNSVSDGQSDTTGDQ